ncbi:putative secreted glycosidase [Pseudocercospora fuligena]|uniref:Putative secreted glycosidase n=1 Tax=Pseudocercospora fuligena TaxID=685502 RepID=A0A8H6VN63_9PEZI|nr:putative secreted glycosidase [Pseudocercospora fuligena]
MSKWQSYQPLGGEETPREANGHLEDGIELDKHNAGDRRPGGLSHSMRQMHTYVGDRTPRRLSIFLEPLSWAILLCVMLLIIIIGFWFHGSLAGSAPEDILQYIDPLIGTGPGGHVFAGASLPFGMAKPVADVTGSDKMGGFAFDGSPIAGFSSLHDSGTGGSPSMGNFPIFLQPSCPNITECYMDRSARPKAYDLNSVYASPGYFTITLENGIRAEMTAGERVSIFRFSFNETTSTANPILTVDASDLPSSVGDRSIAIDPETGRITAEGEFNPSFGQGTYKSYQCIDFRGGKLQDYGVFNTSALPGYTNTTTSDFITRYYAPRQGIYARLADVDSKDHIYVRVGLSWLSVERACENAETEIPDWSFNRILEQAQKAWRAKFKPITIDSTGVDRSHLRNFWSGVYRAFLSPQDYTGENQLGWNSTEPYYDSWYCIWDTFRGVHPFYMLVDTVSQSRMVRSLLDVYKNLGWMPDCRMSFCKGLTQGGSNADVVIVDSFMKKLDGVNWTHAYEALIKDAEEQPKNWDVEGRGGLTSWKEKGYIPFQDVDAGGMTTRSISRTLEYAYNDFCIAQMSNATNRQEDFEKYSSRASNWQNVFNPDLESMGFKGFPQPRYSNGTFGFQNATLCSKLNNFDGCYLNYGGHETYEGSPWLYLFYTPGDMASLITLLGGREAYLSRLDKLHNSGVLYMGDEQAFLVAFLYHYAGRPALSAKKTHEYIPSMFNGTITGIPGNDDSGAMGTFVMWSMLGVFPNAGQNVYFIIPPYFPSISVKNPQTGKTATIRNVNFDPEYKRIYIQSAKLNGKKYTKNWIDHNFFLEGGTLELVLGDTESEWGTKEEDVPPSLSTGLYFG